MKQNIDKEKYDYLLDKYKQKISSFVEQNSSLSNNFSDFLETEKITSKEYEQFKSEYLPPHMTLYEKACNWSEKILKIKPDKKKEELLQESINICHLNITPTGATSFSILVPFLLMTFGSFLGYLIPNLLINTGGDSQLFFVFFFLLTGVIMMPALTRLPHFMANSWRLKASNQMVLAVFYIVTFMRHTSNLEQAIKFASQHLSPPLSLDLKKLLWNVETEKYESLKESLDNYLETWRRWNMEFIEAMHLIESSLYESSEERRVNALEKSLSVILEETYEKMLHYAHNLKSPLTMLHMLGIILPILGLVILPLVVSFMGNVKWYHLATIYNIILPVSVFYLGKMILSSRPTGYGESDISEENPELKKYKNVLINLGSKQFKVPPIHIAIFVFIVFMLIGLSPIIMHMINPGFDLPLWGQDMNGNGGFWLLEYKQSKDNISIEEGPFGLGAAILSFFITLSFGIGIGIYYKLRSQNVIKLRDAAKKLELEFAGALFQLGNRLGDGVPAEIAFSKVANVMEGTISGEFFNEVNTKITKLGLSVEEAIFDKHKGALVDFPSNLIESSMKVFIQSAKKGPKIASAALINVSEYIKEIHKVNERLKDLLAEIISSMKSQISFLTPAISGIVIGITSMITTILSYLGDQFSNLSNTGGAPGGVALPMMFSNGVPTFYFQFIVGIYVIQIVYILSILVNGIENGSDTLNESFLIGQNTIRSTILYCIISLIIMIIFNMVASTIMGTLNV